MEKNLRKKREENGGASRTQARCKKYIVIKKCSINMGEVIILNLMKIIPELFI